MSPGEGWVTGGPGLFLHTATPRWSPPCAIVALPCLPFIPPPPSSGPGIPPGAAGRVAVRPDVTVVGHCTAGQDR